MRPYLAGDDAMRVADLHAALTDPEHRGCIIFATGGSGAQRTLEAPTSTASSRPGSPKVLAGYSDVTAVLEAVGRKLGWAASLMSPMVSSAGPTAHYSFASMLRALMHPERGDGHYLPGGFDRLQGGTAVGRTHGWNLTLLGLVDRHGHVMRHYRGRHPADRGHRRGGVPH